MLMLDGPHVLVQSREIVAIGFVSGGPIFNRPETCPPSPPLQPIIAGNTPAGGRWGRWGACFSPKIIRHNDSTDLTVRGMGITAMDQIIFPLLVACDLYTIYQPLRADEKSR